MSIHFEREVLLTGIGGQGVQLAAKILALAGTFEGLEVLSLGTYGGTMRGGNTDATVVIAREPIVTPPIVSRAWSALIVHPRYFEPVRAKLRPDGLVVLDADLLEGPLPEIPSQPFSINATTLPNSSEKWAESSPRAVRRARKAASPRAVAASKTSASRSSADSPRPMQSR